MGTLKNNILRRAQIVKNDEFYTTYDSIAQELPWYFPQLKGKSIYLNCDDPYKSEFFHYFMDNFKNIGLSKLTATCYNGKKQDDIFSQSDRTAYHIEVTSADDYNGNIQEFLNTHKPQILNGNGDFRSNECINTLKNHDIIITNPPFSLFRDWITVIRRFQKQFLVVANINTIFTKAVFPLVQQGIARTTNRLNKFILPSGEIQTINSVFWFTTLRIPPREPLVLTQKYDPEKYPRFDNYDAINVDNIKDIPYDYDGMMGVPITFITKCPDGEFTIEGVSENIGKGLSNGIRDTPPTDNRTTVGGKRVYTRLFLKKNDKPLKFRTAGISMAFSMHIGDAYLRGKKPFMRIFIQRTTPY